MPKKPSDFTITDQFCGAGGSSDGARRAGEIIKGIRVLLALNHWKRAIETHNANFPNTLHDCTDISACDPRKYPSTNLLITSPECTTHTPAGGNTHKALKEQMDMFDKGVIDPATERSRSTMRDVPRFAEYHNYEAIIMENVVEAKTRWPVFDHWLKEMHILGYKHKVLYFNSMFFHPTPQSRDRMYVVFWKKGNRTPNLEFTPKAYCPRCEKDIHAAQTWKDGGRKFGKYNRSYYYACPKDGAVVKPYYFAAMNIIDWSNIGEKVYDRRKPLKPNTIARIEYGLERFTDEPFLVQAMNSSQSAEHSVRSVADESFAYTTYQSQGIGLPFIIDDKQSTGINFRVRGMNDTIPTVTTDHRFKIINPPFIVKGEQASVVSNSRNIGNVLQTQTKRQSDALVMPPFLVEMHTKGKARPITDTLNTAGAGGIKNGIVTDEAFKSFISYYNGHGGSKYITDSLPTQGTGERLAITKYSKPNIEDCYYRMLVPREVKLGMAFEDSYIITGDTKEQVKQCGNAVTPPVMEWLVQRVVESLM